MIVPQSRFGLTEEFEDELYPDSDGKPMGETDYHIAALVYLRQSLQAYFRSRLDVYVATDMFLYYEEGNPKARRAPDVMIVFGVPKHYRRSFKLWREAAGPAVIIELVSRRTWKDDWQLQPAIYSRLGVEEYFLFDPESRILKPPLRAFRRKGRRLVSWPTDADGGLTSARLGLRLVPEGALPRLLDVQTGQRLLTSDEQAERAVAAAERAAAAEHRAALAEAELARLRARRRRGRQQDSH
jgi:Uma2 family endonuclease